MHRGTSPALPCLDPYRNHLGFAKLDLPIEHCDGLPGHVDGALPRAVVRPFDFQVTSAQLHRRLAFRASGQHGRDQRRTRAGTTSEGFSGTAFPHAHPEAVARDGQDELRVDALGKESMTLEATAEPCKFERV